MFRRLTFFLGAVVLKNSRSYKRAMDVLTPMMFTVVLVSAGTNRKKPRRKRVVKTSPCSLRSSTTPRGGHCEGEIQGEGDKTSGRELQPRERERSSEAR